MGKAAPGYSSAQGSFNYNIRILPVNLRSSELEFSKSPVSNCQLLQLPTPTWFVHKLQAWSVRYTARCHFLPTTHIHIKI